MVTLQRYVHRDELSSPPKSLGTKPAGTPQSRRLAVLAPWSREQFALVAAASVDEVREAVDGDPAKPADVDRLDGANRHQPVRPAGSDGQPLGRLSDASDSRGVGRILGAARRCGAALAVEVTAPVPKPGRRRGAGGALGRRPSLRASDGGFSSG